VRLASGLLIIALLVLPGESLAQTCSVRVISLQFGSYNPLVGIAVDTTADVYVTCDPATPYSIALDAGANSGGSFSPRRMAMAGGASYLAYNVFRDPSRIEIWGDGRNNTFTRLGVGTGAETHFIAYGRLLGGQNVPVGLYGDLLSVLVEW
jgi:spore coat protein U-like protein